MTLLPGQVNVNGVSNFIFGSNLGQPVVANTVYNTAAIQDQIKAANLQIMRTSFQPTATHADMDSHYNAIIACGCVPLITLNMLSSLAQNSDLVTYMGTKCLLWEVGNEPDGAAGGGPFSASTYYTYWSANVPTLRGLAPAGAAFMGPAVTHAGYVAGAPVGSRGAFVSDWLISCHSAGGSMLPDAISFHDYPCNGLSNTPANQAVCASRATRFSADYTTVDGIVFGILGYHLPLCLTEWNVPGVAWGLDSTFVTPWVHTALDSMVNAGGGVGYAMANQFEAGCGEGNPTGSGSLDLVTAISPYPPGLDYQPMVDKIKQYLGVAFVPNGGIRENDNFTSGGRGSPNAWSPASNGHNWVQGTGTSTMGFTGTAGTLTGTTTSNVMLLGATSLPCIDLVCFFQPGATQDLMGVVGRYNANGGTNYYRATCQVSGGVATFKITKVVLGGPTDIATMTVTTETAGFYIHFSISDLSQNNVNANYWLFGASEPTGWMLTGTDSASQLLVPGQVGVVSKANGTGSTQSFSGFTAQDVFDYDSPLAVGDSPYGVTLHVANVAAAVMPFLTQQTINDLLSLGGTGTWLRYQAQWASIEPNADHVYTWAFMDYAVSLCNSNGIRILWPVQAPPAGYLTVDTSGVDHTPTIGYQYADGARWNTFLLAVCARYNGTVNSPYTGFPMTIDALQIENENYDSNANTPRDIQSQWLQVVVNACYANMRAVPYTGYIVFCSVRKTATLALTHVTNWTTNLFTYGSGLPAALLADPKVAFDLHAYYDAAVNGDPRLTTTDVPSFALELSTILGIVRAYSTTMQVWCNEFGWNWYNASSDVNLSDSLVNTAAQITTYNTYMYESLRLHGGSKGMMFTMDPGAQVTVKGLLPGPVNTNVSSVQKSLTQTISGVFTYEPTWTAMQAYFAAYPAWAVSYLVGVQSSGVNGILQYAGFSRADMFIESAINYSDSGGLVARMVDASDAYYISIADASAASNANTVQLKKIVAGTISNVGSAAAISFTRHDYHIFRLDIQGTAITVYMDNVQIISQTDSSISAAGTAGVLCGITNGHRIQVYSLRVQPYGDDETGESLYTRTRLLTANPQITPQLLDITVSVHSPDIGNGAMIANTAYAYVKSLAQSFDDLATQSQTPNPYIWYIDRNKKQKFRQNRAVAAPFYLWAKNILWSANPPVVSRPDMLYRNRQIVDGGVDTTLDIPPESRAGDGLTQTWTMTYAVNAVDAITLDGAVQTFGVQGVDTGKQFYYTVGSPDIVQDLSGTPPATTDTLSFTYTPQIPVRVVIDNTGQFPGTISQAQMALIDGTSGIVEDYVSIPGIDKATATSVCNGLLQQYGFLGRNMTFSVKKYGLAPGQLALMTYLQSGVINTPLLISKVTTTVDISVVGADPDLVDNLLYEYSVEATDGPVLGDYTALFAKMLVGK